jgi:hypothetical protein
MGPVPLSSPASPTPASSSKSAEPDAEGLVDAALVTLLLDAAEATPLTTDVGSVPAPLVRLLLGTLEVLPPFETTAELALVSDTLWVGRGAVAVLDWLALPLVEETARTGPPSSSLLLHA